MKINYVRQEPSSCLNNRELDYIICASGFETRSINIASKLSQHTLDNAKKICFSFGEKGVLSQDVNDVFFKNHSFTFLPANGNNIIEYTTKFHDIFIKCESAKIVILVDYSCMTSILYAALLKYFKDFSDHFTEIEILFCYSPAKFSEPAETKSLFFNQPIPLFDPIQSTDKKIALIIGLGYEEDKALGLYEYFQNDNNDIYLFVTGRSSSGDYFKRVLSNNEKLINITNPDNIIYYDLNNITPLLSTMESLINYLVSTNYRVVIAPIGPKVFSLCSMLINLNFKEVTTYRLSDGNRRTQIDKDYDEKKEIIITSLNLISPIKDIT